MRTMLMKAGVALTLGMACAQAAVAGPNLSSAWLTVEEPQDSCIAKASAAMKKAAFNTRFEVVQNTSVYGERGDYTAMIRCVADKNIAYFVVAGPIAAACSKHMNAMRDEY